MRLSTYALCPSTANSRIALVLIGIGYFSFWIFFLLIFGYFSLRFFYPFSINPIKGNLETIASRSRRKRCFFLLFFSSESYFHYLFFQISVEKVHKCRPPVWAGHGPHSITTTKGRGKQNIEYVDNIKIK